jgi:hypothetical protein
MAEKLKQKIMEFVALAKECSDHGVQSATDDEVSAYLD